MPVSEVLELITAVICLITAIIQATLLLTYLQNTPYRARV